MAESGQMTESTELTITRIFDAPRELVWKVWTEPKYIKRWWGPKDFTSPVIKNDLRVGGRYLYSMRSPEGQEFWSTGVYREIVRPEKIVFTDSFSDAEGNVVPVSTYGISGDWPLELVMTVTFEDRGGRTTITLHEAGIPMGENRDLAEAGWNESLDKLEKVLEEGATAMTKTNLTADPGSHEAVVTRVFDAPRELVFRTFMDPNLIPHWWGPRNSVTTVDTMDARPGGIWRYVQRDPEGNEYAFHGVYHEVAPPERYTYTFEFEGEPGHVLLETVTLEDQNGRTKMTDRSVFQTVEDRDRALASGMEGAAAETMDRFAELLEEKKTSTGRSSAQASL
jgi:uncharacterized protein YndB with AHSA1/START domain